MPEQLRENLADIKEPQQEKEASFEIAKTEELKQVIDQANSLAGKIERDENVKVGEVLDLEEALNKIKIDIGGEIMTVEEIKKNPNTQEQIEIIKEVIAGDKSRHAKLTFLTKQAAESLSRVQGTLFLRSISSLSDPVAEILSHHQGNIYLNGLSSLSDSAAESFSHHKGFIRLDHLSSISDSAAEFLSRHQGSLWLSKEVEKKVDKFKNKK